MSARRPTRAGRLADYLGEMFPPLVAVPATLASFCGVWFALYALDGSAPIRLGWRAAIAAATVTLFSLLLRVYDELKDVDTDLRLGRAGDPRYKDRAVVTGRVDVDDIRALRNGVLVVLVAINLPLAAPMPLLVFAGALALLWLSSRWFFWTAVSRHLLLAFVTHNPLSLAMSAYVIAVWAHDLQRGTPAGAWIPAVGFWLLAATWETSRKVRRPEDETDYQTYSKVLGWRVAALLPLGFGAGAVGCFALLWQRLGLGAWLLGLLGLGLAALAGAVARLQLRPSTAAANLRPFAELLGLLASVGVPVALALAQGLRLGGG